MTKARQILESVLSAIFVVCATINLPLLCVAALAAIPAACGFFSWQIPLYILGAGLLALGLGSLIVFFLFFINR
jgi:hypothetical protein